MVAKSTTHSTPETYPLFDQWRSRHPAGLAMLARRQVRKTQLAIARGEGGQAHQQSCADRDICAVSGLDSRILSVTGINT
jgi:hypothetical protein